MADEAVVRIVLQDAGGKITGSGSPASGGGGTGGGGGGQSGEGFDPVALAKKRIERERQKAEIDIEYAKQMLIPPPAFDPVEGARKRLERERQRAEIDAVYLKMNPPAPPPILNPAMTAKATAERRIKREDDRAAADTIYNKLRPPPPDPTAHDLAVKRLEAEKWRAEIDTAYAKLNPPPPDPTAHELALKRLEAEKKRQEVEAAYVKLKPPKPPEGPMSPREEAIRRRRGESREAQVNLEYRKMFGKDEENASLASRALDVAKQLRGTVGGFFGTLVGAALDAMTMLGRTKADAQKKRQSDLLAEWNAKEVLPVNTPKEQAQRALFQPNREGFEDISGFGGVDRKKTPGLRGLPNLLPKTPSRIGEIAMPEGAGAGGMMGGLAAAAPVIGTVMAIVSAVTKAAVGAVSMVGSAATTIADPSDDAGRSVTKLGEATAKAGESMFLLSPALSLLFQVAGEAGKQLGSFMQAVTGTAERYGEYNPEIATQQAMVEVQRTLGDLRRAQESGPELARFVQIQGDIQQKFEDIKIKLLTRLLEIVNPILQTLERILPSGEGISDAITALTLPLTTIATVASAMLGIQINRDVEERLPDALDPTTILLGQTNGNYTVPQGQIPDTELTLD